MLGPHANKSAGCCIQFLSWTITALCFSAMARKRPLESEQWTHFLESSSDESDEDDTCFEDSLQQLRALLGARYKVITCLNYERGKAAAPEPPGLTAYHAADI